MTFSIRALSGAAGIAMAFSVTAGVTAADGDLIGNLLATGATTRKSP